MPFECDVELKTVTQDEFHAIDKLVMGYVFDVHNNLGRFCDEAVYEEALAKRCRDADLNVHSEVKVSATYRDFEKSYFIDLLIENGAVYELKAAEKLNKDHQKQLLNYLFLTNLGHGKLVNLGSESVEYRFVSTSLRMGDRRSFEVVDSEWVGSGSADLRAVLLELLCEWGTFLDLTLYRDAILHFIPGSSAGVFPVDITANGAVVGAQKMCLLDPETAWHLSAVGEDNNHYETHLSRLLNHTNLKRLHWINLYQHTATLKTLQK